MPDELLEDWYEIGKGVAAEIGITPNKLEYLEARGFLCHELLYLLDGYLQFVETSWKQYVLKSLEMIFPISPICRWYPPEGCALEWIGYHIRNETKVYRLIPVEAPITVFFVEHKPEPPAAGGYIHSLFNVPQLDISNFLQPPFEENNSNIEIEQILHAGLVQKFAPLPMTSEAKNRAREIHLETCKGLWEGFSKL